MPPRLGVQRSCPPRRRTGQRTLFGVAELVQGDDAAAPAGAALALRPRLLAHLQASKDSWLERVETFVECADVLLKRT